MRCVYVCDCINFMQSLARKIDMYYNVDILIFFTLLC